MSIDLNLYKYIQDQTSPVIERNKEQALQSVTEVDQKQKRSIKAQKKSNPYGAVYSDQLHSGFNALEPNLYLSNDYVLMNSGIYPKDPIEERPPLNPVYNQYDVLRDYLNTQQGVSNEYTSSVLDELSKFRTFESVVDKAKPLNGEPKVRTNDEGNSLLTINPLDRWLKEYSDESGTLPSLQGSDTKSVYSMLDKLPDFKPEDYYGETVHKPTMKKPQPETKKDIPKDVPKDVTKDVPKFQVETVSPDMKSIATAYQPIRYSVIKNVEGTYDIYKYTGKTSEKMNKQSMSKTTANKHRKDYMAQEEVKV